MSELRVRGWLVSLFKTTLRFTFPIGYSSYFCKCFSYLQSFRRNRVRHFGKSLNLMKQLHVSAWAHSRTLGCLYLNIYFDVQTSYVWLAECQLNDVKSSGAQMNLTSNLHIHRNSPSDCLWANCKNGHSQLSVFLKVFMTIRHPGFFFFHSSQGFNAPLIILVFANVKVE